MININKNNISKDKPKSKQIDKRVNIGMLFIYCLVFFLTFLVTGHLCDTAIHATWASKINFSNFNQSIQVISYPIWHICVAFLIKFFSVPTIYAASLMNAIFTILYMVVLRYTLDIFLYSNISIKFKNYITTILTFVSSINIPWYNSNIYLGQGSINPWHNPTYIAVKPFAIIAFVLFVKLYKMDKEEKIIILSKEYKKETVIFIALSLVVLISTFAKPSFLQVFLPALIIFLLIELLVFRKDIFFFCLKSALCFLPVGLVLIYQYVVVFGTYTTTDNKIIFSFLEVWKHSSNNILISILLFLSFPIYVLIIKFKDIAKDKELLFSSIMVLVGIGQYALLAESGSRKFDGNFGWGYMLSGLILWITTTICFLKIYVQEQEKKGYKLKVTIGYVLLFMHFITGIYYFYLLWNGAII